MRVLSAPPAFSWRTVNIRTHTRSHPLARRIAEFVRRRRLIRPDDGVLVAVSGGPDSVCLLSVLVELRDCGHIPGLRLHVAHVNYGLRGKESEKDEAFVRELGARLEVPVSCERASLRWRSEGSLQNRARDIRYAYFAQVLRERRLTAVATGHTADDQAETVLLWLLRGSGSRGLAGIPIRREGGIIRPLLGVTRSEVLAYLSSRRISYRIDASNETGAYRRNRVRHELLPMLRSFNPRIVEGLAREAEILAAESATLDEFERERWQDIVLEVSPSRIAVSCERLAAQPLGLRRRLVRRALALLRGRVEGLTYRHVDDVLGRVLEGRSGVALDLPGVIRAGRDGDRLTVELSCAEGADRKGMEWGAGVAFPVPGEVQIGDGRRLLAIEGEATPLTGDPDRALLVADTDRFGGSLLVRTWRKGDWFCPAGMAGHRKKLQDFFVDQKVPRNARGRIPLVVAPAGIVWVVGYRGDERFKMTVTTTRPVTLYVKD
jgi:tRNA(Ile)-lysidine synthase